MDSTILINNPLTTNMKSSTKLDYVGSSFLNLKLLEKKTKDIRGRNNNLLFTRLMIKWGFWNLKS
jgi:hypothetical protein